MTTKDIAYQTRLQIGLQAWSQVDSQVFDPVWRQVVSQVNDQVKRRVENQVVDQVWKQVETARDRIKNQLEGRRAR